ncbi:DUF2905 domain-containing protein [Pseudobacter ginsenosidimutans]|uniref:DUF2905 family protein n=1 Tax=Pseudobacter ginsenosidimutans TaxID=661488 RepID=A0A4Q7MXQ4_9BACT|nr:DUF2905 domain-containing protein [Pseudobacter ginsenosidimutans]QEC41233.1 DUF2905 domain-containing protein [Pseudobacter ginsenosidimutans]RZS71993.1 DUF2905 family protein [Pseudobacter ginsenosidimutans]
MNAETGKYIMITGVLILVIGAVIYFFHDKLHWIGRLPGDIRVERENFRFYFPITTMILLGLLASLVIRIFRKY